MLNEERIKLMTGIAMFEKKQGKQIFPLNIYFKGDYISKHMVRSFFVYTFCCLLLLVLWVLYQFDALMNANTDILFTYGKRGGICYLIGLTVYLVITYQIYSERYDFARRGLKVYFAKLRRLDKRYEFQGKTRESVKGEGTS